MLTTHRPADGRPAGRADSSPFLTRRQVAAMLNVSEKWLAQSGRHSGPRFYKFGASCRYHRDDVNNWARQQKVVR